MRASVLVPRFWVMALMGALFINGALPVVAQQPLRTLSLTATGEVSATPDMAVFDVSVSSEAPSARAALGETAETMARVFGVLDSAGIAGADRATTGLSLREIYDRDDRGRPGERIGFVAAQSVRVQVRALDTLGELLDSLTGAGLTGIGGIDFTLSDPAPLRDEARRRAIAEAGRLAALMAEAAGQQLGPPVHIELLGNGPRPPAMRMAAVQMSDAAMPVAEGVLTIEATVSVSYALE